MQAEALLTLSRWLSPGYPTGGFNFSAGLESAVAAGLDKAGLEAWLSGLLCHGAPRTDALFLHLAHAAPPEALPSLAERAAAMALGAERLAETLQQGAAFAATTRASAGLDLPDMPYPLAVGRAARLAGLPAVPACALFLQAQMSNMVQAALRLMPLGQTAGAGIMERLAPLCARLAEETAGQGLADLGTAAFAADVASLRHEVLAPRMFRS
ncbi:urease accessory protein UreF [Pseudoroseicyclus tamaricis]|uniref:Urease accessory protein UreF n=1 Tax=Pseudoroseicyclus tamaricis TaxID=2705421 RepID=A0A6B2JPD6_9RHOB|nr:urease accessory UreF family protein [Pseudoroseicyclus tamaricis]NDU99804.1 urease accessory protein UreF [Pseudoroseicyclus tamaricis]